MRNNVVPFVPMMTMLNMGGVMFCAHDEGEHTLCYGPVAKAWMLENPVKGLIRTYPNLIAGLSELERASGNKVNDFTITDNPYGD